MTRFVLVRKTLRDSRAASFWIGVAAFTMALLDALIYPQYRDQLAEFQMPDFFRGLLGEAATWTSPAGFFSTEFFSWVPLLLITLAIIGATGTLAGEESAGTLDLLLAHPINRARLVLEKAAGLGIAVTLAALASMPGFLLGVLFVDIGLSVGSLTLATLSMLPVVLLFLTFSLWASATLPSRGAAAGVSTAAVVLTYVLNMVGATVDLLETPRRLSPFYWSDASRVLLHGFDWARAGALLALAALFLLMALWRFERRDIGAGARDWRFWPGRLHPHSGTGVDAAPALHGGPTA